MVSFEYIYLRSLKDENTKLIDVIVFIITKLRVINTIRQKEINDKEHHSHKTMNEKDLKFYTFNRS